MAVKGRCRGEGPSRRDFVDVAGAAVFAGAASGFSFQEKQQQQTAEKPPEPFDPDSIRTNIATDPVAADKVGWDFIFKKRVEQGIAQAGDLEHDRKTYDFLARAENLGLGVYSGKPIDHRRIEP